MILELRANSDCGSFSPWIMKRNINKNSFYLTVSCVHFVDNDFDCESSEALEATEVVHHEAVSPEVLQRSEK
jgi:hypothetical protein